MPHPLLDRSAPDLAAALRSGAVSAADLASACLDRIAAREPDIAAWTFLDADKAMADARALDVQRALGRPLGPLHGLPVGVKDIIDTFDMPTENGTPVHRGRRPAADATLVARLRAAGALVLGKTVTSELAVYTPGPTRNPHDLARTPGGSSSGSAAAVAAGMVPLALATQTNGSTIRPASFCGIVGYKPSLGLLPRTGVLKQCFILDQPGLMARDLAGAALLAEALAGADPADEASRDPGFSFPAALAGPLPAPRLAFVRGPYWEQADASAREALDDFVAGLGGTAETMEPPPAFASAAAIHKVLMNAGIAEAFGPDYDRARDQLSSVVTGIVEAGRALSAVDFVAALSAREALRTAFAQLFAGYDAVVTPAALGVAPPREDGTGNPIMATTWTLLGAPALTLPLLRGAGALPLGVQLVGHPGEDRRLLRAAAWLERQPSPFL
ncbi:amidase [Labrys monachus]|uniref:Asp-tRNA(Asn)/Glu-tRNA(Gln) amidotransferase A subunit family amidase n=1 Tax=Labrys monachus TaxID=217067 RepID=A0ABU0F7G1_9HYPH|nr:amidase [Labrys monachus]MDQ0390302.1 Asp-tRNA(Asn)/Glu-tRNA(Gln) amidotransferase A subunit family amidase [Labrys monachus]